jgi:hypothetical protein
MDEQSRKKLTQTIVLIVALAGLLLSSMVLVDGINASSQRNLEQPYVHLEVQGDSLPAPEPTSTVEDLEIIIQ